jgi:hypothetical protein
MGGISLAIIVQDMNREERRNKRQSTFYEVNQEKFQDSINEKVKDHRKTDKQNYRTQFSDTPED